MTAVVGLDPSLTGTGIAMPDGHSFTVATKGLTGARRLMYIRDRVIGWVTARRDEHGYYPLVAIEGYSYASANQAHQVGELGGVLRVGLTEAAITYVDIPPSSMKRYAAGRGNATKADVLVAAVRRLGYTGSSNDEADALWLRAMACDALGTPVVDMPAHNRQALDAVPWPQEVQT